MPVARTPAKCVCDFKVHVKPKLTPVTCSNSFQLRSLPENLILNSKQTELVPVEY